MHLLYIAYVKSKPIFCPSLHYFKNFYKNNNHINKNYKPNLDLQSRNNNNNNRNNNRDDSDRETVIMINENDDNDEYYDDDYYLNNNNLNENNQQIFDPSDLLLKPSTNMANNPSMPERAVEKTIDKEKNTRYRYTYKPIKNYGNLKQQFCYII